MTLTFPAQFIYANALMSEMVLQAVLMVMLSMGLLFIRYARTKYFAAGAMAMVVAISVKPVFYPLSVVFGGLALVEGWRRHRPQLAIIGMVPLLAVILYMEWNEQRTGYFHYSSIAEINLLHYNAGGVVRELGGPEAETRWVAATLREANAQPSFKVRQQFITARAEAMLWAHAGVYTRQHVQGMAALVLDPGRFDITQFMGLTTPEGGGLLAQVRAGKLVQAVKQLPVAWLAVLGLVVLANLARLSLAVRGFRVCAKDSGLRTGRWLAVGLLLYVAVLTGPLGAARFLVPVWPVLLGLALLGLRPGRAPAESARK